jgi:ribosome assembly protein 1
LNIANRELKSKESRLLLASIFSQWLSLSTCIVQAVIDVVPSPAIAQAIRLPRLLHPDDSDDSLGPKNKAESGLYSCNSGPDACVLVFVSKMFAVSEKQLLERKVQTEEISHQEKGTKSVQHNA